MRAAYYPAILQAANLCSGGAVLQFKSNNALLTASSNVSFNQSVPAGATVRVRFCFTVPKDGKPKTLAIREATSRTYEYDVSQ